MDARTQQQTNERLDAAVVDACFVKLDAIVSEYERLRTPTDDQTLSAASTFSSALERQCGMKARVEADPRFQSTLRRIATLNARWSAIQKKKCQALEVQMNGATQDFTRGQQARKNSVCYQTCIGNGFEENTCLDRCGLGYTRGDRMGAVRDEMKKWSCK